MTALGILDRLHRLGMNVRVDGQCIIIVSRKVLTDELRALIRENKSARPEALTLPGTSVTVAAIHPSETARDFAAGLRFGYLVLCECCVAFEPRRNETPGRWSGPTAMTQKLGRSAFLMRRLPSW